MSVAEMVEEVLGADLPVAFEAYDGSRCGPADAPATLVLRSPTALQRIRHYIRQNPTALATREG